MVGVGVSSSDVNCLVDELVKFSICPISPLPLGVHQINGFRTAFLIRLTTSMSSHDALANRRGLLTPFVKPTQGRHGDDTPGSND